VPHWVVVGAGTGGTSATIGRYTRYRRLETRLCVVDPEGSVFADYWETGDASVRSDRPSRVEGIGRQQVEPSFLPEVVDRVLRVPDAATLAGLRVLEERMGRRAGPSTGTNLYGALTLIAEMLDRDETGSVVTLICDPGDRYDSTWYSPAWLAAQGLDATASLAELHALLGR
jgi:cysteine synthase A